MLNNPQANLQIALHCTTWKIAAWCLLHWQPFHSEKNAAWCHTESPGRCKPSDAGEKNISLGSWNPVAPHLHSPQVKFQNFIFSRPKKLRILKSLPPILNLPSVCTGGVIIKDRSPKIRQRWNATIFEDFSTKQQSPRCRIRQDLPKEKLPVQKSFVFGCQGKETELRWPEKINSTLISTQTAATRFDL